MGITKTWHGPISVDHRDKSMAIGEGKILFYGCVNNGWIPAKKREWRKGGVLQLVC